MTDLLLGALSVVHTAVKMAACSEKDKYLNNLFYYNFDRYVKFVIFVNDWHLNFLKIYTYIYENISKYFLKSLKTHARMHSRTPLWTRLYYQLLYLTIFGRSVVVMIKYVWRCYYQLLLWTWLVMENLTIHYHSVIQIPCVLGLLVSLIIFSFTEVGPS